MHNYDTIYSSGLRLFLSLVSYALLYTLIDGDLLALYITTFTYVISKWVDILDTIHQRKYGTVLELIGVATGIILASTSILLIAINEKNSAPTELIYVFLAVTAFFIVIDFASFGTVLKKFNKQSQKNKKTEKVKEEHIKTQPNDFLTESPP